MTQERVRIELLGEPRILVGEQMASIPRTRVRALAYYLAATGKPVPRATLSWLFWPDSTTDSASRALSIHLSYLRSALPQGSLITSRTAVGLAPHCSTDIADFELLSASGSDKDALAAFALFRGAFLEGFALKGAHPFDQWVEAQQTRWTARFAASSCRAASILTARGEAQSALEILDTAAQADPLNEEIYRRRMRIMAQSGMRAQVGALYQGLVERLNEALGIPPSQETVACYQEIIGSNDDFTASVRATGQQFIGSEDDMPFIGREEQLKGALEGAQGRLVLVQGQAGIGKTRFLSELAKANGMASLTIALSQQGNSVPFSSVAAIVRAIAAAFDWAKLSALLEEQMPADIWATLCCLAPDLSSHNRSSSAAFALTALQVAEAFSRLIEAAAERSPLRILIDDFHNVDASSLSVFRSVPTHLEAGRAQFVVALSPALMNSDAASFFNGLQKADLLRVIRLERLSDSQMMEVLLFYFPDIDATTANRLVELADGNPYWMRAIVRGLDSGYTEFSGKNSLESLFDFILRPLSPEALTMAEKLAVMEEPCEFRLFGRMCHGSSPQDVLLELSTAGITALDHANHVGFLHTQMRNHIFDRLSREPQRLATAHLRVAQGMEELYGESPANAQDIAITNHYLKSTHPETCAPFAAKAGDYLLQVDDVDGAIHHFKLAVRYLEGSRKLDCAMMLYMNMTHRGQLYEADLYVQEAITVARGQQRQDYALAFEAARSLVVLPEFKEVQAGVIPCYRRDISPRIIEALDAAENEALSHNASVLLVNYILGFKSSYYMIRGDLDRSKDCLNRLIGRNLWYRGGTESSTNMLLQYSAIVTLIAIMNWFPDERIYGVIQLEEEIFRETPINSFSATSSGVKALLTNIRGDYAEGERLMDTAIAELRKTDNRISLASTLVTQAMLVHRHAPGKAYAANLEAYQIAQEGQARYTLVRALIGLVVSSPYKQEAITFLEELRELAGAIGDESLYTKVARVASKIKDKRNRASSA